jgi:glutamate-ammonia-ligase adenylyltransferase
VHRLPSSVEERARLARALGLSQHGQRDVARAAASLEREILRHRRTVMSGFDGLFEGGAGDGEVLPPSLASLDEAQVGGPVPDEARSALRAFGLRDPEGAYADLAALARTAGTPMHPRSPARVRAIMSRLLSALCSAPDPDLALRHACALLMRMRGRIGSYALLRENPATLGILIDLFGTSDFLAKLVVQRPELLDPLVIGVVSPRRTREDLARDLERMQAADEEERLDLWRRFQAEELLRIGLSDVAGTIDLLEVQAELTALAEALADEALRWALSAVAERYGQPAGERGLVPLCVVGMGKLGGRELNYNSDLDLLFLYGGEGVCAKDPTRGSQEFFSKVAQRLLFGLACVTSEGFLYHIDARLRPSGRHGSLVSSVPAFAHYHEASAQIWERLALTRARPVAGPAEFQREVKEVLARAAYERPFPPGGAREVDRLRQRMEGELAREGPERYNVKLGRGGLVDVEFATQLLQLREGARPEVRQPGTLDALAALLAAGVWDAGDLALLREAYLFLRRLENRLRIFHDNAQSVLLRDPHALAVLARRMGFCEGGAALLTAYEETTTQVRDVYRRVVEAMP